MTAHMTARILLSIEFIRTVLDTARLTDANRGHLTDAIHELQLSLKLVELEPLHDYLV